MPRTIVFLLLVTLSAAACGDSEPLAVVGDAAPKAAPAPPRLSGAGDAVTAPERDPAVAATPSLVTPGTSPYEGPVEVRVLDDRGRPVAGAEVSHLHGRARTDEDGLATIRIRPPDRDPRYWGDRWLDVRVRAEGRAEAQRRWNFDRARPMVFRLYEEGFPVRGRCVDASGRGVSDLRLSIGGLRVTTDADGGFENRFAPARELPLEVTSPGWIAARQIVVPPAEHLLVPVRRPARIHAWLRGEGWPFLPEFEVEDGERDGRYGDHFRFRCVPGPVRIAWRGREIARVVLAEGEVREDLELWVPEGPEGEAFGSWVEVDLSAVTGEPAGAAWGQWAGPAWVRLGKLGPRAVTRLPLPAPGLERLRVRVHLKGVWEEPAAAETRVILRSPKLTSVRLQLIDAAGRSVRSGKLAVRAPGCPDPVAYGHHLRRTVDPPDPRGPSQSPPTPDRFLVWGLGPGIYDLDWIPAGTETRVRIVSGLVVGAHGGSRDLGAVALPLTAPPRPGR